MFEHAGAWFWTHVIAALLIIWSDINWTLEPAVDRFEKSLGIRTELPEDSTTNVPYYIPPITEEVDSTWILPDSLRRD